MSYINLKPQLNKLLEEISSDKIKSDIDENLLNQACEKLWHVSPFAHIRNFSEALKSLEQNSAWISYGGNRTGSTFTTMALTILLDSMIETFLIGWEGDFKNPEKFFDLVESTPRAKAGILKIHRNEEYCNNLLKCNKARAVVTTRDYPSIAGSYARMRENPYSPFHSPQKTTKKDIIHFIDNQISNHSKKKDLPNTLFVREDEIRARPQDIISKIASHFGIQLTDTSALFISKKLNIESQRKNQKEIIVNSTGHSKDNFLHHNHVNPHDGEYNKELHDLIFDKYGDILNDDGYLA